MAKKFYAGIIGGGQLALMLGDAAKEMGWTPIALCKSSEDPAFKAYPASHLYVPGDAHSLEAFFAQADVVAFENEFFSDEIGQAAGAYAAKIRPSLDTILQLRDKFRQKELFTKLGLATAPYKAMPSSASPESWTREMLSAFGGSCVFKWALGGYDGKGVCVAGEGGASHDAAIAFCTEALRKNVMVFAEAKVAVKRELAIIGVRSMAGYSNTYPLTITEVEKGVCNWTKGPAVTLGVPAKFESEAARAAGKIAVATNLIGVFAIEFFETEDGQLLINEMAPRVHNTGHYTTWASQTSQFMNHWQAITGQPLGDTTTLPLFAMKNLLGPEREVAELLPIDLKTPEAIEFKDYRKNKSSPGRKLGHLNGRVDEVADYPALLTKLQKVESQWRSKVEAQALKG